MPIILENDFSGVPSYDGMARAVSSPASEVVTDADEPFFFLKKKKTFRVPSFMRAPSAVKVFLRASGCFCTKVKVHAKCPRCKSLRI